MAAALVFGGTLAGAGAASAAIIDGTYDAPIADPTTVIQGENNQAATNVNYSIPNSFAAGDTIAFNVEPNGAANTCPAGAPTTVGYSIKPTVTLSKVTGSAANVVVPAYTSALSSSGVCGALGVQDILTVTLTDPDVGDSTATDRINIALTGIQYNVGTSAPVEDVNVDAGATDTVVNATVVDKDFSFIPREAALPSSTNNALGTATYTETTAGAFFKPGVTSQVSLDLDGDAGNLFTTGVTPTITAPAGYTVVAGATDGSDPYTFTVAAPATAVKAVVTVAGLRANTGSTIQVANLDSVVTSPVVSPTFTASDPNVKALNILNYGASQRIGGDTRYETAAALFNAGQAVQTNAGDNAVLSGGELFPDALSANYLASAFDTGTLLTTAKTLSPAARNAILNNAIDTVYITGETGAVSQAIQDQIESLHVGNNPNGNFIQTVRLGGDDRYDTNRIVNNFASGVTPAATPTVLMSSGENFPDALAFGPIAYSEELPLILTQGSLLSDQASSQLNAFEPDDVVISGATGAVSAGVSSDVSATGATVSRLGGADRSETATMIAEWATGSLDAVPGSFLDTTLGFSVASPSFTWTGLAQGFGDALAAGPLAGWNDQVILLTNSSTVPGEYVEDYLAAKDVADVLSLRPLGQTGVTSNTLMKASAASIENP